MLGIAIINYNKWEKTVDCIKTIFENAKMDFKIYLLDNASQNNSFEELSKLYCDNDKIVLIKSDDNLGYARGNNLCIDYAKKDNCEYILISNNDILFENDSINILYDKIQNSDYLLIEPFIKNIDGSTQICVKKEKPTFKEYMDFSTYLHNFKSKSEKQEFYSKMQPETASDVYWASGACFIADMKKFENIGFFDPYTFLYFEEYIISEKAVKKGYKLGFEPTAKVIHYHGASSGGSANYITRIANFESEIYFFTNYWKLTRTQLEKIRCIRCLEVLFTFSKEKKFKNALKYIQQSRKIIRKLTKGK